MPIYEYKCPKCKHETEELQKISDPNPDCEECEKERKEKVVMKRQISKTSFQLKGGGWAKDGYSG